MVQLITLQHLVSKRWYREDQEVIGAPGVVCGLSVVGTALIHQYEVNVRLTGPANKCWGASVDYQQSCRDRRIQDVPTPSSDPVASPVPVLGVEVTADKEVTTQAPPQSLRWPASQGYSGLI